MNKRARLLKEMNETLEWYCADCFLKQHHRDTFSVTYAQNFCINQCSVGERLSVIGACILQETKERRQLKNTQKRG
ncbi:MAG: zinc-finger domain-containing protein [Bacilli bacterium]